MLSNGHPYSDPAAVAVAAVLSLHLSVASVDLALKPRMIGQFQPQGGLWFAACVGVPLEEELVSSTVVMLEDEDKAEHRDHYLDGLRNLLAQPEFADKESVSGFVRSVEDGR